MSKLPSNEDHILCTISKTNFWYEIVGIAIFTLHNITKGKSKICNINT